MLHFIYYLAASVACLMLSRQCTVWAEHSSMLRLEAVSVFQRAKEKLRSDYDSYSKANITHSSK